MDDTAKEKKIIRIIWATITAIVFPFSNLFIAMFCETDKDEDMEIGILMLILAFVSCCLSAFVVIADYVG